MANNVDVGKMRHRITFRKKVTVYDELGQDSVGWADYKTVWATVTPYKASDVNVMSKSVESVTHRIYVRYHDWITPDMRIDFHGRIFEMAGPPVDMDEAHTIMELQCTEVVDYVPDI
jgi:SPP1 family predicted phage head-tail adaptor